MAAFVSGCGVFARTHSPNEGRLDDPHPPPEPERALIDLSSLKLFRAVFAVDYVGPYESHFALFYEQNEPVVAVVRVHEDPSTHLIHIVTEHCAWGAVAAQPESLTPAPPALTHLRNALEQELRVRMPQVDHWDIDYLGTYRPVTIVETVPLRPGGTTTREGRSSWITLAADASLTHLVQMRGSAFTGGNGTLQLAMPLRWVNFEEDPRHGIGIGIFNTDAGAASPNAATLASAALEAARRWESGEPGPTIDEIARRGGPSFLPPDLHQRLFSDVKVHALPKADHPQARFEDVRFSMPFDLDVVPFGEQRATQEAIIAGEHLFFTMTLTPKSPLQKNATPGARDFEGTLHWHVHDDQGYAFDRDFRVVGDLLVDGTNAVAPYGFQMPDVRDAELTQARFPGRAAFEQIEMSLSGLYPHSETD
jgi:hypothetical protein